VHDTAGTLREFSEGLLGHLREAGLVPLPEYESSYAEPESESESNSESESEAGPSPSHDDDDDDDDDDDAEGGDGDDQVSAEEQMVPERQDGDSSPTADDGGGERGRFSAYGGVTIEGHGGSSVGATDEEGHTHDHHDSALHCSWTPACVNAAGRKGSDLPGFKVVVTEGSGE
jgi:hypothetical protein